MARNENWRQSSPPTWSAIPGSWAWTRRFSSQDCYELNVSSHRGRSGRAGQYGRSFQYHVQIRIRCGCSLCRQQFFPTYGTFGIAFIDNATCISIINEGDGEALKYFAKGHVKKGCVVLSNDILNDPARLNDLVNAAAAYVQER